MPICVTSLEGEAQDLCKRNKCQFTSIACALHGVWRPCNAKKPFQVCIHSTSNTVGVRRDVCVALHERRLSYRDLSGTTDEIVEERKVLYCQCTYFLRTILRSNSATTTDGKVPLRAMGGVKYQIGCNCSSFRQGSRARIQSFIWCFNRGSHVNMIWKQWHSHKKKARSAGNSNFCIVSGANITQ